MAHPYFTSKPDAIALANKMAEDPRISYTSVEMEPYNGWTVIVVPRLVDVSDLHADVEVRSPAGHRVNQPFGSKRKAPAGLSQPREGRRGRRARRDRNGAVVAPPPPPPPPSGLLASPQASTPAAIAPPPPPPPGS